MLRAFHIINPSLYNKSMNNKGLTVSFCLVLLELLSQLFTDIVRHPMYIKLESCDNIKVVITAIIQMLV